MKITKKIQDLNNDMFIATLIDDDCNITVFINSYITSIKIVDNNIDFDIHFSFSMNETDNVLVRRYKLKNLIQ